VFDALDPTMVTEVVVNGIDDRCEDALAYVRVAHGNSYTSNSDDLGAEVVMDDAEGTEDNSATITLETAVAAHDITGVAVTLNGGTPSPLPN
jgi:hypothetical protein